VGGKLLSPLIVKKEHTLRVFGKMALRKILGSKADDIVTG
jgi:hypothetical protein